jgi:DNA-binding NarL/FixJ family response regulator
MTAPDGATVRVLTVDDQRPFRVAAAAVVRRAAGFELVGEAPSGEEALRAVAELGPDLVLMDINMPGMGGIEATRAITAGEHPPVVFLCSTYQARDLPADAQDSGAAAYIDKEELASDLLARLWAEHRPADGAATASATTG